MDKEETEKLAADLLKLMRSGNDARTQIDFISNSLRIKKRAATRLQEIFSAGINAGCNSVIENSQHVLSRKIMDHPLFLASYQLGREDFVNKLKEQRLRHKPEKNSLWIYGLLFILVLAFTLLVIAVR